MFIPIEPCRLVDHRPIGIGPRRVGHLLLTGRRRRLQLPTTSTGALDVTAENATRQTGLRFFPADNAVPGTADLTAS